MMQIILSMKYIPFLAIMFFVGCTKYLSDAERLKNWHFVKTAVKNATKSGNERNVHIKQIYNNLSDESRSQNLILLNKIKLLETDIKREVAHNTDLLEKRYSASNDEVLLVGIEYINAIHVLDSILPQFYKKIQADINGDSTLTDNDIIKKAEKVLAATEKYELEMNAHRKKYNLDVPEISINP